MPTLRTLIATLGFAVASTAVAVAVAGGQSGGNERAAVPDGKLKKCGASVAEFDGGPSVAGMGLVHREALCSEPDPVRSESAGGQIDPDSYTRAHYTLAVYGTCKATSDHGCAPPLEIQTWPACERSPADYTVAGEPLPPTEVVELRGVPARFYGDNRLELSTGDVTVVIFGESRNLVLAAVAALRTRPGSPAAAGANEALAAPVTGSEDGTLSC
jgi:hypothetical protein